MESWEDQGGNKRQAIKIIIEKFQFLQGKGGSDSPAGSTETPAADNPFSDEDIPF
jgi:single-stranded DNA-binding protein